MIGRKGAIQEKGPQKIETTISLITFSVEFSVWTDLTLTIFWFNRDLLQLDKDKPTGPVSLENGRPGEGRGGAVDPCWRKPITSTCHMSLFALSSRCAGLSTSSVQLTMEVEPDVRCIAFPNEQVGCFFLHFFSKNVCFVSGS